MKSTYVKYKDCKTLQELKEQLFAEGKCTSNIEFQQWIAKNIPLESFFQKQILAYLRKRKDCVCFKVHNGMYCQRGVPDIICIKDGRFYGFEVKRPWLGKLSALQMEMKRKIECAGGNVSVVSYAEQVKEVLEHDL